MFQNGMAKLHKATNYWNILELLAFELIVWPTIATISLFSFCHHFAILYYRIMSWICRRFFWSHLRFLGSRCPRKNLQDNHCNLITLAKHLKKLAMLDVLILGIIVVVLSGSVYKKQGDSEAGCGHLGVPDDAQET